MSNQSERKLEPDPSTLAARRALIHLFDEFERARLERDAADKRLARFAQTIQVLLDALPQEERGDLSRRFEEIRSGTQHRGGEVFGNVIALFRRDPRKEWTVPEVQSALEKSSGPVDAKAVANAIGYLTKTGCLKRIARGHYIALDFGAAIVDLDGPDDGTGRRSENDD